MLCICLLRLRRLRRGLCRAICHRLVHTLLDLPHREWLRHFCTVRELDDARSILLPLYRLMWVLRI